MKTVFLVIVSLFLSGLSEASAVDLVNKDTEKHDVEVTFLSRNTYSNRNAYKRSFYSVSINGRAEISNVCTSDCSIKLTKTGTSIRAGGNDKVIIYGGELTKD
jgi:hypothetical protein